MSVGVDRLWRFIGLEVVSFVLAFVGIIGLVGLGVAMFLIHWAVGLLYTLVAIPAGVVLMVGLFTIFVIAGRALVVRDGNMADSIEEGYHLFRGNMGACFVMILILLLLSIGLAIVWAIAMALLGIPIAAVTLGLGWGLISTLIAGFIMALPLSLLIGGFAGTWFTHLYTLFYFQLVEPAGPAGYIAQPQNPTQPFGV